MMNEMSKWKTSFYFLSLSLSVVFCLNSINNGTKQNFAIIMNLILIILIFLSFSFQISQSINIDYDSEF